jgi:hypothetical protein
MNTYVKISLAALALAGFAQLAHAASSMMSEGDTKMMDGCMAMSSDAMMKDKSCTAMMKKMNVSNADMKTMKNCKTMANDAMMKDKNCSTMMSKHPDMMKMSSTPH